jgi:hypothetical protein
MKAMAYIVGAVVAVVGTVWLVPAHAYRPFDGTDADVLDQGEMELELGYLHYLREGSQKSLETPVAVMNLGMADKRELVFEGRIRAPLSGDTEPHQTRFRGAAISLKQMHREGSLQEGSGPSVASECGLLLPVLAGERIGAGCALIVSERGVAGAVHLNGALNKNREGSWEGFLGTIVEAAGWGAVRPVGEVFVVRDSAGRHTESALAGMVWTARKGLAFDVALRKARTEEHFVSEIRIGLTWALPVPRSSGPTGTNARE